MQDLSCRQIYLLAMEGLNYTIKKLPARTVVGITRRTSNAVAAETIPACWQEFLMKNAPARIAHRSIPPVMYAVYSQYEKDWTGPYTYLLGCGVTRADNVPEGMEAWTIPEQTYAVFRARGMMPAEILGVWANVWSSDLPRTYTYDFELYDKRFTRPLNKEVEVCVAVEPKDYMEKTA
ncbi:GyrI-like domain-containing protein [Methanoregula sp.]|uniref:GyrI-like domain-containing protein n=1 Tax=Methanoregula sp. TaxID=2052170 RepID=UPI00236ADF68|nr:GyrI-like domain-containing protein [Methanoregula sp.]MDD1687412.1 GyrI-like domain-containing protein [Methanoregula sp.]